MTSDSPAGAVPDPARRVPPAVRRGDAVAVLVLGCVLAAAGAAFTVAMFAWGPVSGYGLDAIAGLAVLPLGLWIAAAGRARVREAARIARLSEAATATVTAVEVTRSWINEYPRCRIRFSVAVPDRPVYPAEIDKPIPGYDVPRYRPGDRLTAWVDPGDPDQVAIVDDWDDDGGRGAELLASGLPGTAEVSRVFDAPPALGRKTSRLGLALQVTLADGRPGYEAELAITVTPARRGPRRGERLAIRADPEDQRLVVIDWDSSPRAHPPAER
jgi:Protein of unknown function (DUF3592)